MYVLFDKSVSNNSDSNILVADGSTIGLLLQEETFSLLLSIFPNSSTSPVSYQFFIHLTNKLINL